MFWLEKLRKITISARILIKTFNKTYFDIIISTRIVIINEIYILNMENIYKP